MSSSKLERMKQLISRISNKEQQEVLTDKLNQIIKNKEAKKQNERKGGNGMLEDKFNYNIKGRIVVDKIDSEGNVIGNILDKDNLVVDKADEIVLRALSGDSGRTIYKNRKPKGGSQEVHVSETKLNGLNIIENGEIVHDPSILWSEADDSLFDVEFAYFPEYVFIEEVTSDEAGKKAFKVYSSHGANRSALAAEVYSTYSNLFIGLGEGKGKEVNLEKFAVKKSSELDVNQTEGLIELKKEKAAIEFDFTGTRLEFDFEEGKNGGTVEITVDGEHRETVETGNSELEEPRAKTIVLKGLDGTAKSKIKIAHKGSDIDVPAPTIKIIKIVSDQLSKEMNGMFSEFKNFRTKFDTRINVNTTPEAPYTVKVPHHPVKPETLIVQHRNKDLKPSTALSQLDKGEYFYDKFTGLIYFHSALTDASLQYEITGEFFETKDTGNFNSETINHYEYTPDTKANVSVVGAGASNNPWFILPDQNIIADTLEIKVDGAPVEASEVLLLDLTLGRFKLAQAHDNNMSGSTITASYQYNIVDVTPVDVNSFMLTHLPEDDITVSIEGKNLKKAETVLELENGCFYIDKEDDEQKVYISLENDEVEITHVYVTYMTEAFVGHETGYTRSLIEKPKEANKYPWFQYDTGSIRFVAQFHENVIKENVTIREMGLFDGPRIEDEFKGFGEYPVKAFSLIRIPETVKNITTGIQVTWVITLLNEQNNHYKGGNN